MKCFCRPHLFGMSANYLTNQIRIGPSFCHNTVSTELRPGVLSVPFQCSLNAVCSANVFISSTPGSFFTESFHSFFRSTGQTVKRQTENLHVDYYVTRDFKSEYKGSALQQIEKNVEEDYVSNVRNNCWKERQTSEYQSLHSAFSPQLQFCFKSHCFFPTCLTQKQTCCTLPRCTGTTECARRPS